MANQLVLIAVFALVAGLLSLFYQQSGAVAVASVESSDIVRSLRARLADAEARAARVEATRSAPDEAPASRLAPVVAPAVGRSVEYIHTIGTIPAKPGDLMMMTYATGGVREMLYNWVLHVQRLGLPVLVSAMDADVVRQCTAQEFHCLDWSHTATSADQQYVRGSFDGFRALGVRKLDALLPVLRAGIHVVLSDVDCVWSSSPLPMFHGKVPGFEDFAFADVLVATDCMSPEEDLADSGCYHDTVDKNTGVLAIRASPNGIAAMAEWRVRLAVGQKDEQDQASVAPWRARTPCPPPRPITAMPCADPTRAVLPALGRRRSTTCWMATGAAIDGGWTGTSGASSARLPASGAA